LPSGGGIGINAAPTTNQLNISSGNITVAASSSSANALAVTSGTATFANAVTLSSAPSASTDAVNKAYADTHILGSPSSGSFASPAIIGQAIVATSTSGTGSPTWGNVVGPTVRATLSSNTSLAVNTNVLVPFNNVTTNNSFDTNGCFNTSSNSFLPTVPGYYQINAGIYVQASVTGTSSVSVTAYAAYIYIYKSGSLYSSAGTILNWTASGTNTTVTVGGYARISDIVKFDGSTNFVQIYTELDATGTPTSPSGIIPGTTSPGSATFFNATFIHP
jgi:hypothetical protein